MRTDRLSDLHPANVLFADISKDFTRMNFHAVGKRHYSPDRINIVDVIILILLHTFGKSVEVIINTYDTSLPVNGFVITDFKFQTSHRRLLW